MVYKRRTYRRRRRSTRKTAAKSYRYRDGVKSLSIMRRAIVPKLLVKRMSFQTSWTFSTATTAGFWQYFSPSISAMSNFNEFATVFDEYKICAIKYTFRPRYDNISAADVTAGTGNPQVTLHTCIDPSSTLIPTGLYSATTLNTFLENSGVRSRTLNRPLSVYFRPMASDQLTGGGTATRSVTPGWIKVTENTVSFRGFHAFLQSNNFSTSAAACILDVFATFYVQFRNLK